MTDNKNRFVPHQPEEEVDARIKKREAVLLKKLRKVPFGKCTIHKADGIIVRVEIQNSELIKEDGDTNGIET